MLLYFRYRQLALECSPDSTSAPQVFRTCSGFSRARRGAARRTDDQGRQTLVVEGDVLAIDWQPWLSSRFWHADTRPRLRVTSEVGLYCRRLFLVDNTNVDVRAKCLACRRVAVLNDRNPSADLDGFFAAFTAFTGTWASVR